MGGSPGEHHPSLTCFLEERDQDGGRTRRIRWFVLGGMCSRPERQMPRLHAGTYPLHADARAGLGRQVCPGRVCTGALGFF